MSILNKIIANKKKEVELKKKLFPMAPDPPTAMLDSEGKLVTDPNDVTDAAMKYFKQVL